MNYINNIIAKAAIISSLMAAFILFTASADASRFSLFVHGKKIIELADLAYDVHKIGRSSAYINRSFRSLNICKNNIHQDCDRKFDGKILQREKVTISLLEEE